MDMISLKAKAREAAKPGVMRRNGLIPCVVYGKGLETVSIQVELRDLHKTFAKAGESTLVEIDLDGKKIPVLFKHVSFEPISGNEEHVDFYAVNMKQEIETDVRVHFEGESLAVKELGGIFVVVQHTVRVKCLPSDLPHNLPVSMDQMAALHDTIAVKDLKPPKGVTIMDAPESVIATVQEPRKEEEIVPPTPTPEEAAAAAAAEGAPAAEGAAPGAGAEVAAPAADAKADKKEKK